MRKLGLTQSSLLAVVLVIGCKTAPEPSPAEASAPQPPVPAAPEAPTAGTPSPEAPPPSPEAAPPGAPAPTPSAAATDQPLTAGSPTYSEGTKSISAKVGSRFAVALPSNITIPMKWRLEPAPDGKLLSLTEEKHFDQPPPGCDGCVGYGGTRLFSFEAKAPGKQTLKFALRPLTDPKGKAQKEVSIDVAIGN
jgi:predicted secreted protein